MSFEEFGLSPELKNGLADVRIEQPTPLQKDVIPPALQGKNMLVKNEAEEEGVFLIPALQKLTTSGEVSGTKVLILTPSIERAKQLDEMIWAMGYHAQISSAPVSMKGNKQEQEQAVKDGAPILVANPGRLIEILNKNKLTLSDLELIIMDEAQDMENYSLVNRVKDILKSVDGRPQTLIFSKSYNKATRQLAEFALQDEVVIGFDISSESDSDSGSGKQADTSAETEADTDSDSNSGSDNGQEDHQQNKKDNAGDDHPEQENEQEAQQQEQEQEEETEDEEDFELNMEEVKRKLAEASVDVVLNPEEKEEEEEHKQENKNEDSSSGNNKQNQQDDDDIDPEPVPKNLEQGYIYVPPRAKISTLLAHLDNTLSDRIVVFAASKRTTDRLFRIIRKKGWGVVSINEGLDENTYNDRFSKFTNGDMKILLVGGISATDVDIEYAKQVINYDVPSEVEEYKYRAEMVGKGKAARIVSLVSKMDREDIDKIVKEVGYSPTEIPLPEEVKDKKKGKGKSKKNKNKSNNKNKGRNKNKNKNRNKGKGDDNDDRRRRRRKPKPKQKKENGLPVPNYEGLSGGREGKGKRPSPSDESGAFGWIKKLFN